MSQTTTNLTKAEIACLREFDDRRFSRSKDPKQNIRASNLVKMGFIESMLCGDVVTYRTNDSGKRAIQYERELRDGAEKRKAAVGA